MISTRPRRVLAAARRGRAEFAEATGARPLRHEGFADYVRQDAMLEDERRLFTGNPYTWGDHFWWYLQMPRRVYLG
jgi:hypothetical protein